MLRTARFLPAVALLTLATSAAAAPTQRKQLNQHGDFLLVGNTLGYDCANGTPAPVVGTVGACGTGPTLGDTAPDVYWRSEAPGAGQAQANSGITNAEARSTAVLTVPAGATVSYARLYWGAKAAGTTADKDVTLDRPGGTSSAVTADVSNTSPYGGDTYYQSSADVTAFVAAQGSGTYRVGGVSTSNFVNATDQTLFAGWYLVVFYQLASEPPRNLTLFDGLDLIGQNTSISTTIQGFLVPNAGFDAKLGVVSWEGDASLNGDYLRFNGNTLSNAQNPANNFFNGTRTWLGAAVSNAGDLPQLTGTAGSQSGVDFDVIDVKAYVKAGDTAATITAGSQQDVYWLGAFVTSIATFAPDFSSTSKTVVDLNGGSVRPGDVLEYTITAKNAGNDASIDTVLTDVVPQGVTFVPGTIQITAGANAGAKTDQTGDDQGEYDAATRKVTVRLGTGANATTGGTMAVGATTTVKFQVTVDASASGTINNQAIVTASGQLGAPSTPFPSDKDGNGAGNPTPISIDECTNDADCTAPKPFCLTTASPKTCVACLDNSSCSGTTPFCNPATHTCGPCAGDGAPSCTTPGLAACQTSGALAGSCTECSSTDTSACGGAKPVCLAASGTCGCAQDPDCQPTEWCDTGTTACTAKLANGTPIPNVPSHTPPLTGTCDAAAATAVCASAVCDAADDACGYKNGDGTCDGASASTVCRSGACGSDGVCGLPNGEGPCDGTNGATVCRSGNCDVNGGVCAPAPACATDADCASDKWCEGGSCVPKLANGAAMPTEPGHAPTLDGKCDAAAAAAVCASGVCDTADDACGYANGSGPCDGTNGATVCRSTLCATTGPNAGTCVACLSDGDCSGATPICDTASGACTTACTTDADCGTAKSGRVCDDTSKLCADGCRGTGGNGCPTGLTCSSTTAAIGQCESPLDGGTDGPTSDADTDAGKDAASDAKSDGAVADASDDGASAPPELEDAGALEGGGCACEAAGSSGRGTSAAGLVAVGLALAIARRRRRG